MREPGDKEHQLRRLVACVVGAMAEKYAGRTQAARRGGNRPTHGCL
jgi:hypothetical protein